MKSALSGSMTSFKVFIQSIKSPHFLRVHDVSAFKILFILMTK